jgi:hypothetical protein
MSGAGWVISRGVLRADGVNPQADSQAGAPWSRRVHSPTVMPLLSHPYARWVPLGCHSFLNAFSAVNVGRRTTESAVHCFVRPDQLRSLRSLFSRAVAPSTGYVRVVRPNGERARAMTPAGGPTAGEHVLGRG